MSADPGPVDWNASGLTVPPGFPRAYVPPAPTALARGGYQLCDGCSHGLHLKHAPAIRCDCDLCQPEAS